MKTSEALLLMGAAVAIFYAFRRAAPAPAVPGYRHEIVPGYMEPLRYATAYEVTRNGGWGIE